MKSLKFLITVTLSFLLSACDLSRSESAEKGMASPPADTAGPVTSAGNSHITWDSWGVPHIVAGPEKDIFFADGWAQMQAHANTILKLYGRSRGRAAEYWGEEYLESDKLIHNLGHPEMAASQWEQQDPQSRQILFSRKQYRDAWLSAEALTSHTEKIEWRTADGFTEK
jgi:acyl-homoserine lactone acylase PvdQ